MKQWTKYALPISIGLGIIAITHFINRRSQEVQSYSASTDAPNGATFGAEARFPIRKSFASASKSWSYITNKFGPIGPSVPKGHDQKIVKTAQEFAENAVVVDYLDRDTVVNLIWSMGLGNIFSVKLDDDGNKPPGDHRLIIKYDGHKDNKDWYAWMLQMVFNNGYDRDVLYPTTGRWSWERNGQMIVRPWKYMSDSGMYTEELVVRSSNVHSPSLDGPDISVRADDNDMVQEWIDVIRSDIEKLDNSFIQGTNTINYGNEGVINIEINHQTGQLSTEPRYVSDKDFDMQKFTTEMRSVMEPYAQYMNWKKYIIPQKANGGYDSNVFTIRISPIEPPPEPGKYEEELIVRADNDIKHYFYTKDSVTKQDNTSGLWQEHYTVIEVEGPSYKAEPIAEEYAKTIHAELAGGYFSSTSLPSNFETNYTVITPDPDGEYTEELIVRAPKDEKPPTVAIDFDSVISHYQGWKGEDVFGNPIKGASEGTKKLKDMGYMIAIWTTRRKTATLEEYLNKYDITYDAINETPWVKVSSITSDKIMADVYIDNRAITFRGDWSAIPSKVKAFKPWNR